MKDIETDPNYVDFIQIPGQHFLFTSGNAVAKDSHLKDIFNEA